MFNIIRVIINIGDYMNKKIKMKKIIGLILLLISIMLFILFAVVLNADYLNWYMYSSPFYLNVIVRCVEFILPGIISLIIGIILLKKE